MGSRRCRRCGEDITLRHGNAKYCLRCTSRRSKPYVHSVRLNKETHERLLEAAKERGEGIQQVLEETIRSVLRGVKDNGPG
jgi:hypothetical protein